VRNGVQQEQAYKHGFGSKECAKVTRAFGFGFDYLLVLAFTRQFLRTNF
jgi:hypothetical protein